MTGATKINSHSSHFCVRKEQIETFVCCIDKGETAELQDNDSDGYINITLTKDGFFVQAQIGGSHEENIYIEFMAGSKSLLKFCTGLRELLNFEDTY